MKHRNSNFENMSTRRRLGILSGLLGFAICFFTAGCSEKKTAAEAPKIEIRGTSIFLPENAPQRRTLTIEEVRPAEESQTHLTGRLVWDDSVTARIFSPVVGRVIAVAHDVGETVLSGDTLALLQSSDLGQAQADSKKAAADAKLAERTLNRLRELFEHGAAAKKDLEAAEDDFENKITERDRAVNKLALYGATSDSIDGIYAMRAPLGGVVVERNINIGQEIRPDQMLASVPQLFSHLFVISDPKRLWLLLDVTESEMQNLCVGQSILIRTKACPDVVFHAQLENIGASLDPSTRTIKARCVVDNSENLLKAEMYVTADLVQKAGPGIAIPSKAVFLKNGKRCVFLEGDRGQFECHEIRTGLERDGKVLVLDGLARGQRMVISGSLLLEQLLSSSEKS